VQQDLVIEKIEKEEKLVQNMLEEHLQDSYLK